MAGERDIDSVLQLIHLHASASDNRHQDLLKKLEQSKVDLKEHTDHEMGMQRGFLEQLVNISDKLDGVSGRLDKHESNHIAFLKTTQDQIDEHEGSIRQLADSIALQLEQTSDQEHRLNEHSRRINAVNQSLDRGNDKFAKIEERLDEGNAVMTQMSGTLALVAKSVEQNTITMQKIDENTAPLVSVVQDAQAAMPMLYRLKTVGIWLAKAGTIAGAVWLAVVGYLKTRGGDVP